MVRWSLNLHFCVVNCLSLKLKGTFREDAMMSLGHVIAHWRAHVSYKLLLCSDELHDTLIGLVVLEQCFPDLNMCQRHLGGGRHFWNPDCWAPPPEFVLQSVWGRAQELVFRTNCQMVLMLLLEKPLSESYWVGCSEEIPFKLYPESPIHSHAL